MGLVRFVEHNSTCTRNAAGAQAFVHDSLTSIETLGLDTPEGARGLIFGKVC